MLLTDISAALQTANILLICKSLFCSLNSLETFIGPAFITEIFRRKLGIR